MLPRALLFSSDEPTVTVVREVLTDLEIEVVHCREIFAAVEELTTRNFQAILIDWAQELEASFLFNIARELKSTKNTYSVVIVEARLAPVLTINPDAFLEKPFTAEQVREAILSAVAGRVPLRDAVRPAVPMQIAAPGPVRATKIPSRNFPEIERGGAGDTAGGPEPESWLVSNQARMERAPEPRIVRRPLLRQERSTGKKAAALACLLALLVTVVHAEKELGYLPGNSYRSLTQFLLVPSKEAAMPASSDNLPSDGIAEFSLDNRSDHSANKYFSKLSGQPAVRPVFREGYSSQLRPLQSIEPSVDLGLTQAQAEAIAPSAAPLIPSSLYLSPQRIPMFQGLPRATLTPASWSAEPILVPEETSRSMLIREVSPNYPLEALRAGLQGPVVFQVLVGRDGTIEDLKLVRGYFALGLAAVDAVKQWRFRPYRVNGEIVEMRTFLTVTFPVTSEVGKSNSNGSLMTYGTWR
jgi:TonB family protein